MKKSVIVKIIAVIMAVLFTSCSLQEPVRLMNAEGLEGVEIGVQINASLPETTTTTPTSTTTPPITTTSQTTTTTTTSTTTTPQTTTAPQTTTKITTTTPQTTTAPQTTTPVATTTPAPAPPAVPTAAPVNSSEVMGVWISYLELQETFSGRTEASFRKAFAEKMDNCRSLGINTVYVHLRAFGDAYYKSELFPWAKQITGTIGQAPDFDPLKIMLEEAHSRGIAFHGWLNPMRLPSDVDIAKISGDYPLGRWYNGPEKNTYIVKSGDNWFLNPAYPEVRKLIADGAAEILRNYDVDGLHIDDYFYPPNVAASFDKAAFDESGYDSLSQFRLDNCTKMVKSLYDTVKAVDSSKLFGISPQGNIKNCYDIYADVRKWASQSGYCDYIAPQLYYGFDNALQPFDKCLSEWEGLVKNSNVKLVLGLAVYKIGVVDAWAGDKGKSEWVDYDDIIKRQIELSRQAANYGGVILFSYNYLFAPGFNTPAINAQLVNANII